MTLYVSCIFNFKSSYLSPAWAVPLMRSSLPSNTSLSRSTLDSTLIKSTHFALTRYVCSSHPCTMRSCSVIRHLSQVMSSSAAPPHEWKKASSISHEGVIKALEAAKSPLLAWFPGRTWRARYQDPRYENTMPFHIINPVVLFSFWNQVHLDHGITAILYQWRIDAWADRISVAATLQYLQHSTLSITVILVKLTVITFKFVKNVSPASVLVSLLVLHAPATLVSSHLCAYA